MCKARKWFIALGGIDMLDISKCDAKSGSAMKALLFCLKYSPLDTPNYTEIQKHKA